MIVKNKDGLEIGRGTGTFSVTVSQAELDKAKNMGGTMEKLAEAKALVAKGQLDEGITLIDQVTIADPKNAEAKNLSAKWKKDRTAIQAQLAKVKDLINKQAFADAAKELTPAKNLHALYPPVVEAEKELNEKANAYQKGVNDAVAAINEANQKKDFKKALQLCTEIRSAYKAINDCIKAIPDFGRAISLQPGNSAAYNGRGHAFVRGYPATGTAKSTAPAPPKPPPASGGTMVTAIFENRSSENVHIFVEGENFGPENPITPGGRREAAVRMPPDGRIKFISGRNGQVIATKIWNGDPSDTKRYPRVVFDGNDLLITTGLR